MRLSSVRYVVFAARHAHTDSLSRPTLALLSSALSPYTDKVPPPRRFGIRAHPPRAPCGFRGGLVCGAVWCGGAVRHGTVRCGGPPSPSPCGPAHTRDTCAGAHSTPLGSSTPPPHPSSARTARYYLTYFSCLARRTLVGWCPKTPGFFLSALHMPGLYHAAHSRLSPTRSARRPPLHADPLSSPTRSARRPALLVDPLCSPSSRPLCSPRPALLVDLPLCSPTIRCSRTAARAAVLLARSSARPSFNRRSARPSDLLGSSALCRARHSAHSPICACPRPSALV